MSEKLSDSWRGWVRTHADGADREYGYVLCTITASLELELAQAQADVEALEKAIRNALDEMGDNREVILEQALAEHLRGASG